MVPTQFKLSEPALKLVPLLLLGAALSLCLPGCGGNAVSGAVANQEISVQDGFYTDFVWEDTTYSAVVLADFPGACDALKGESSTLGGDFRLLQMWLTAIDLTAYPVYAPDHLGDASSAYGMSFYTVYINDREVINTDGVAGVVEISGFDFENKQLSGSMDLIYSGNGNRLQGAFSVPYCAIDWESISRTVLAGVL